MVKTETTGIQSNQMRRDGFAGIVKYPEKANFKREISNAHLK